MRIRPATPDDAAAISAIYAPFVENTCVSLEDIAPDSAAMAERIASTLANYPWLVAERDSAIAGYAYASQHRTRSGYRRSVDVAVYVAPASQGGGLGRALYDVLLKDLARADYHAAFAGIALPNPASIGLHEAAGFIQVGTYREVGYKFGRWVDVAWFQRLL